MSRGELNWESKSYSDYDNDGCRDLTEDFDDDNDNVLDINDDCWRGYMNWDSIPEYDYDGDGCYDSTEDTDDDSDGVNDVNETGVVLDLCPRTPLNATDTMRMVVMQQNAILIMMEYPTLMTNVRNSCK